MQEGFSLHLFVDERQYKTVKNPPICAQYATPPVCAVATPREDTPMKSCMMNQKTMNNTAEILVMVKKMIINKICARYL